MYKTMSNRQLNNVLNKEVQELSEEELALLVDFLDTNVDIIRRSSRIVHIQLTD